MSRVKRGMRTRARHHKILKQAKGYFGHTMLTATEEIRRETSESFGSSVSMLLAA